MNFTPIDIEPSELFFDYQNPRIAEFNPTVETSEYEIIKILWSVMGVEEIVLSIKASGFFNNEPLIAIKERGRNIVIEGNRRLAAIKCILDSEIADYIGLNKNLFLVTKEIKSSLEKIPVIFVDERKDAWKFIGFKHINGPAKWGSYAKAQYISEIKKEYGVSLGDIAAQIGDTHKTVQKLYQGLQVISQAEKLEKFDRSDISASRLYFSHLYTGLSYDGFKEYLGIRDVGPEQEDPVPIDKIEHLEQLLIWIFGSRKREIQPVIQTQNPDLRRLESILKNKEARAALKDGVSLYTAYELSQPKSTTFEESLLEAKRALQKAYSYFTEGFNDSDEELVRQAGSIANIAEELYDAMEKKWKLRNGQDIKKKRMSEE